MVEKDNYLLECGRYIERNPLRAGIVKDLREYPWSSYRVYGYGKGDGLPERYDLYEVMGKAPAQRQRAYRECVCSNRDKEEQEVREKMGRRVIEAGRIERVKR
jgi:putative transposase